MSLWLPFSDFLLLVTFCYLIAPGCTRGHCYSTPSGLAVNFRSNTILTPDSRLLTSDLYLYSLPVFRTSGLPDYTQVIFNNQQPRTKISEIPKFKSYGLPDFYLGFLQHFGNLSYASGLAATSSASYPILAISVLMFSIFVRSVM